MKVAQELQGTTDQQQQQQQQQQQMEHLPAGAATVTATATNWTDPTQTLDWTQQNSDDWNVPSITNWAEEVANEYPDSPVIAGTAVDWTGVEAYQQQQQAYYDPYQQQQQYFVAGAAMTHITPAPHHNVPIMATTAAASTTSASMQHHQHYLPQQQELYLPQQYPPQQQQQQQYYQQQSYHTRTDSWYDKGYHSGSGYSGAGGGRRGRGGGYRGGGGNREVTKIPPRFQKQKQPQAISALPEDELALPVQLPRARSPASEKPRSSRRATIFAAEKIADALNRTKSAFKLSIKRGIPFKTVPVDSVRTLYEKISGELEADLDACVVIHAGDVEALNVSERKSRTDVEKGSDSDKIADSVADLALELSSRVPYLKVLVSTLLPRFDRAAEAGMAAPNTVRRCMNVQLLTRLSSAANVRVLNNDRVLEWYKDEKKRNSLYSAEDGKTLTDHGMQTLLTFWAENVNEFVEVLADEVEDDAENNEDVCESGGENVEECGKVENNSDVEECEFEAKGGENQPTSSISSSSQEEEFHEVQCDEEVRC